MQGYQTGGGALDGIEVVEFGDGVAVGYCGALLRACGARVCKVEPPLRGDSVRHLPPFAPGVHTPEASGMHAFLAAGKRSVALDLDSARGAELAGALAARADVVLEALGPGRAAARGLGFEQLAARNRRLVMASLSWFGATGRRRDWAGSDAVVQALSGFIYPIGEKAGPPMIPGGYHAQVTAGVTAFIAIAGALVAALDDAPGVHIDQSVLEAQTTYTETTAVRFAYDGARTVRKGLNKFNPTYPQTLYPAADGWIGVTVLTPAQWRACCELLGAPHLIDDPRFATTRARNERADELDTHLGPLFAKRPAEAWFHEAQARRVPFALVPTQAEIGRLDHFTVREVLARFEHADIGGFDAVRIPWKLAATPLRGGGVAPRLGVHTEAVLATVRAAAADADELGGPATAGASRPECGGGDWAPLTSIRIIDFTMGWSGPLATRHLADLGADVIKVEACKYPDWWRGWEHTPASLHAREHERSPAFNQINRNKRGVAIDLTVPRGRELALQLVGQADAVIENQATGVMDKLGLSFDELRAVNPGIIMLSLPAFGAAGPWAGYRGYGSTAEHGAGLPYLTGDEGGPPVQTHVAYGDACGGLNAAAALLTGLFHRKRTGEGQRIELSQTECLMQLGVHGAIAQGLTGAPPPRTGRRHPSYVPHGIFAADADDARGDDARGDDPWVVVALTEERAWPALARLIGQPAWAEAPEFRDAAARRAREDDIEASLGAWVRGRGADEAMIELQAIGVAAGAVRQASELLADEALRERALFVELERAVVGRKPHPATPWRVDGRRARLRTPSPTLGEHNREVLAALLGLSAAAIAGLEADGVIGDVPTIG